MTDVKARLDELERARAKKQAELAEKQAEQELADLEAFYLLEEEHGPSNVSRLEIGYTPGLPIRLVVRCPTSPEVKRYRAMVKPKRDGQLGDTVAAAELLAAACRVYPAQDEAGNAIYKAVGDARPGVYAQLGILALALAQGTEADEGKG